jgi:hypothetical protein
MTSRSLHKLHADLVPGDIPGGSRDPAFVPGNVFPPVLLHLFCVACFQQPALLVADAHSHASHLDLIAGIDQGVADRAAPSTFPEDTPDWKKLASELSESEKEESDQQLILTYLAFYRLLERALLRAGWYGWVRHIDQEFDPGSSEELGDSVAHLLDLRNDEEPRPVQAQNRLQWESDGAFSRNLWLADMLQQTTMQLSYRYDFAETPGCDAPQVMSCLFVVEAWLQLVAGDEPITTGWL